MKSFIFDASTPVSPERQAVAKAMMQREQMNAMAPAAMPQNVGEGIQALGNGIINGLEARSLQNQANAPVDPWADMRQTGSIAPVMGQAVTPGVMPGQAEQPPAFGAIGLGFKKLFGS